ncbi:MAG TPA: hypothetical protein VH419_15785, partial [Nocardioidaceae bacterium]
RGWVAALACVAVVSACSSASDTEQSGNDGNDGNDTVSSATQTEPDSSTPPTTTEPSESTEPTETEPTGQTQTGDGQGGNQLVGTGYSVEVPQQWEDVTDLARQQNAQADIAMAEPQQSGKFRTNFNVVRPNPIPDSVTDAQLAVQAARELNSVTHNKVSRLDGPDFDGEHSLGQTSKASASGFSVTLVQYLVRHDGKVYATTMTFDSTRAAQAQQVLDDIVDSWSWTG